MTLLLALSKGKGGADKGNYKDLECLLGFLPMKVRPETKSLNSGRWDENLQELTDKVYVLIQDKTSRLEKQVMLLYCKRRKSGARAKQQNRITGSAAKEN